MNTQNCPLCAAVTTKQFAEDAARIYYQCAICELVFVPAHLHLSAVDEKAQYDLHENNDEPHYRHFLQRVYDPLVARLDNTATGLDFGCGPGPVLARMLRERGHSVMLFDQFYFPDNSALQQSYHFITATEVLEHLQRPRQVIEKLWSCLQKNGILAVMTKLVTNPDAFSQWHYKTDPTHIIFFSVKTFQYLAKVLNAKLEFIGKDVILLSKME